MRMELIIRRVAGSLILASLLLAHFHSRHWLWLTAFVGLNLLQSSFTNFCPLEKILRKLGVGVGPRPVEPGATCCRAK
jgi:Inner membrane protein YgaP-like, transmembrane domain